MPRHQIGSFFDFSRDNLPRARDVLAADLRPREYMALLLRYMGYSLKESGEAMDLSRERIRSICAKAHKRIRQASRWSGPAAEKNGDAKLAAELEKGIPERMEPNARPSD